MRKFHFRLQSILDVRRYTEDQRKMELGAISSRCAYLEREIRARRELRHSTLTVLEPGTRAEDITYRHAQAAYAQRLKTEAAELERKLETARKERTVAVERYREARKQADVLDRLRRRQERTYFREQKRDETKRMDEIAMSRRMHHADTI